MAEESSEVFTIMYTDFIQRVIASTATIGYRLYIIIQHSTIIILVLKYVQNFYKTLAGAQICACALNLHSSTGKHPV